VYPAVDAPSALAVMTTMSWAPPSRGPKALAAATMPSHRAGWPIGPTSLIPALTWVALVVGETTTRAPPPMDTTPSCDTGDEPGAKASRTASLAI